MHKATTMAIIFTVGLWTGGIFSPHQTPASEPLIAAAPQPHPQPAPQENPERDQP